MPQSFREVYASRKMMVLLGLGFASGLPLLLTSRTLRVWARREEMDLTTIGLLSLVTLPYAYKFLWAPLLDRFSLPLLGRRRGWLLLTQVLLMAAIGCMALSGPDAASGGGSLRALALFAVMVAFTSATQDVVADAYRTDVLEQRELGAGASIYTTGYRLGMLGAGAGAVFLAASMPWKGVYFVAATMMIVGVMTTLAAPEPVTPLQAPRTLSAAVVEPFAEFMARNGAFAVAILLFVFLFKVPDYLAAPMTDALLIDLGFSNQSISIWSLGLGTAVTIPGALVGGAIVTRLGLGRSLLVLGLAQALSNAGYLALAWVGRPIELLMIAVVAIEYFCMGLVAAGFIAFLMSQCHQPYSATQYALLSSLMGLANSLAGAPAGFLVDRFGYWWFFTITIAAALPGLVLLPWLSRRARRPRAVNPPAEAVPSSA